MKMCKERGELIFARYIERTLRRYKSRRGNLSLVMTFLEESCQLKITFIDNITVRFAAIFPKFWSGFFLKLLFGVTKM